MKILKILIRNINSLEKDHLIDFQEDRFVNTGLFAITGETGAGKTTILDAMTLALYGRVPRGCKPEEMMTHGSTESLAEIEFECKKKKYRASWSLKKAKKTGKVQPVTQRLSEIGDQENIIGERIKEIEEKIEGITGLDYHRFLRSVLLAQGDFAAFLKAKEDDQATLLEKITGLHIYSEISRKTFEIEKENRTNLEKEKNKIDQSKLLTPEQKTELSKELENNEAQAKISEKEEISLQTQIEWLKSLENLRNNLQIIENQIDKIKIEKEKFAENAKKLELNSKAAPFKTDFERLNDLQNRLQNKGNSLENLQISIPEIEKKYLDSKAFLEKNETILAEMLEKQSKLSPEVQKVRELDQKIQEKTDFLQNEKKNYQADFKAKDELEKSIFAEKQSLENAEIEFGKTDLWLANHAQDVDLTADLPILKEWFKNLEQIQNKDAQTEENLQKEQNLKNKKEELLGKKSKEKEFFSQNLKELQTKAEVFNQKLQILLGDSDLQEVSQQADQLLKEQNLLAELLQISGFYVEKIAKISENKAKSEKLGAELSQFTEKKLEIEQQSAQAEDKLKDLQKIYEQEQLIKNYEQDRQKLEAGKPCFLCGSLDHPFVQHYQINVSESKENRDLQVEKLKNLQKNLKEIAEKITEKNAQISFLTKELQNFETESESFLQKYENKISAFHQPIQIQEIEILRVLAEESEKKYKQIKVLQQESTNIKSVLESTERQIFVKKDELNLLDLDLEKLRSEIQILGKNIENLTAQKQDSQVKQTEIRGFLAKNLEKYAESLQTQNVLMVLEKRQAEFQQKNANKENSKNALETLKNKISLAENDLKNKKDQLEKWREKLIFENTECAKIKENRKELFDERDLFAEEKELEKSISEQQEILQKNKEILDENAKELTQKSTLKEALQKEIQEIKTDFLQQQTQFESNILAQGFENKADFTNAILTLETEKNLQKQAQELKENEVSTQKKWQENLDLLKETENKNLAVDSLENIENQVVELKKLQKELQQNIGKISEQLRQHEKLEQEFADLQQKIDVLKQKHHRWEQLNALIGSADGKKFKIFAQSLTLAKLVGLANRHLEKLNVRYKIRKNPNESMELLIIDTYQADHVRSMKTLSGGESFLVSLALALGLSDLASRHTNIDSLFIDEGFGTLDQDTLQMVLGTLANLQASGKMVGIISHVEGLKEAISTKIHVKKLAGGVSTIEVSG